MEMICFNILKNYKKAYLQIRGVGYFILEGWGILS